MLGENIKKLRELRGLSINALAKLCNVSPGYISDLEKNKKQNPSTDLLERIAIALAVNVQDLFDGNKEHDEIDQLEKDFRLLYHKMKNITPSDRKKILKMIELFESENNDK